MGFGDFLRGVVAQVNPFDNGKTYGTYNPPRKRREDEERFNAPQVRINPEYDVDSPVIQVRKPKNEFGTLNNTRPGGQQINNTVPVVKEYEKPQSNDKRSLGSKVFDQVNPFDNNRTFQNAGQQKKPNFVQRNLSPTGIFNIGKEVVQGAARYPIELGGLVPGVYSRVRAAEDARARGATESEIAKAADDARGPSWQPSGWQKRLFGDAPIKPLSETGEDLSNFSEEKLGVKPNPAIPTGALMLLSLLPGAAGLLKNSIKKEATFVPKATSDVATTSSLPAPQSIETNIPVNVQNDFPELVNVRNLTEPGQLIQEVVGDATTATPNPLIQRNAQQAAEQALRDRAFEVNRAARPDPAVEGITIPETQPYSLDPTAVKGSQDKIIEEYATFLKERGQGNGVDILPDGRRASNNLRNDRTKGKRMTNADWLEEAKIQIESGQAPDELIKAYKEAADPEVQSLLAKGEQPDTPVGKPIAVKEVKPIEVIDKTNVPKDLPETPGTVRTTTSTDPLAAKTQLAAKQTPTVPIPKVGSILPDGTKVTRRMVATERSQRKLSNQLAKQQEGTALNMERISAGNGTPLGDNPGIIKSGKLKKSKNGVYESATLVDQQSTAATETSTMSGADIITRGRENIKNSGSITSQDRRAISDVLFDNPRYKASDPEFEELVKLYKEDGTALAQEMAMRNNRVARRTQTGTQISNHTVSKMYAYADDPTKVTDEMISSIQKAADEFADLRDAAVRAADEFNGNPTRENYNKFNKLSKQADKAETNLNRTEYDVAKKALKGNKNVEVKRFVEDQADKADQYTMDFVDSALLSSTGTFVRNFTNAGLSSVEEGLFGGVGARAGRLSSKNGEKGLAGGGIGRGSFSGFGNGVRNIVDASKARAKNAGWNPIEHMKNWSTTGNQLGDTMIGANVNRGVRNHYETLLKREGYSGDELRMRADVMARTDPQNIADTKYAPQARKDAGLGSGVSKRSALEKTAQRWIADQIGDSLGPNSVNVAENVSKAVTRAFIGFPSAVGRSIIAGSQRVVPLANADTFKIFTSKNADDRALAIKNSIKKSGTAATMFGIFNVLGGSGAISGPYPDDPNERARWERDGKKANSIKIGGAWYDLPSYMGSFGVPIVVYSAMGRNGGLTKEALIEIGKSLKDMSPTESLVKASEALDSENNFDKYTQNLAVSATRMATPYGSLLNQLSKVFDETQNDTSSDSWAGGVLNKIIDGIPFVDTKGPFALPDKTDKEGNTLYNPSVVETMVGAAGAVQTGGVERSKEIDAEIQDKVKTIDKYGLLNDKNIDGVLESTGLEAYNKLKAGKKIDESDIKALQEGLVKNVDLASPETAYLERGQYDTHLGVLKLKRDLKASDPTVPPSSLERIETEIKRGEIYKDKQIPYEDISNYKSIDVEEWRDLGDPESENYDKDLYQKLWDIDQLMTKDGVSYKRGDSTKAKYYEKQRKGGSGRGRSGARMGTDFGTLKASSYGPKVKEYASIGQQTGSIPRIKTIRPNIYHKITTSG